jgi:glycerol-3-phosphate acyltransferase PlsY
MGLIFLGIVGAYLLGSIPFGLIASKLFGTVDPRNHGSYNIGFTNVLRVAGKKAGIATLAGDAGKGYLATTVAGLVGYSWPWILAIGLTVVLGHIFSIFLSFKGGKGVATALGVIVGVHPLIGGMLILTWIGTVFIFRYSSGGALAAFGIFPFLAFFLTQDFFLCLFSVCIMALIYGCHKDNIVRLFRGTENKIRFFSS